MTEKQYDDFKDLMSTFKSQKVRDRTFLEISKYPRLGFENVCSNILSFYFDPNNEHGLEDLLLKSFFALDVVREFLVAQPDYSEIEVLREDATLNLKRIDILIKGKNFVIGIENKIEAALGNDLISYKNKLKSYEKEILIPVVLSVKELNNKEKKIVNSANFALILYRDFFNQIEKNMYRVVDTMYRKFLLDFINTIKNKTKPRMQKKYYNWFADNENRVIELQDNYKVFKSERSKYL